MNNTTQERRDELMDIQEGIELLRRRFHSLTSSVTVQAATAKKFVDARVALMAATRAVQDIELDEV